MTYDNRTVHQGYSALLSEKRTDLIACARAGDASALGLLLDSYRSYLSVLADIEIGRRLQQKVDASDIVQETFLEAHRQFPNFQGEVEPQLTEWLRTILAGTLANTVRRYFGTQARNVRLERELADDLNHSSCLLAAWVVDPGPPPSDNVAQNEQTWLVVNGLAQLSEDYRRVLILRHLDGLAFSQIAAQMGRSVDSVEKLWVRGLAKLKQACAESSNHD